MKRAQLLVWAAVLLGVMTMSAWLYTKYFRNEVSDLVLLPVSKMDLAETVKVRGKLASKNIYNLGFADGGTVARIYVTKGDTVKAGDALMSIDSAASQSALHGASAALTARQQVLAKLRAGSSAEELAVTQAAVDTARTSLSDAQRNLVDVIAGSYTIADNAMRANADSMISNPRTNMPQVIFPIADVQLKVDIERQRVDMGVKLREFAALASSVGASSDLNAASASAAAILGAERDFLALLAQAVNGADSNVTISQAQIDAWKTAISTARSSVETAIASLTGASEKWRASNSALAVANTELSLRQVGARGEDIAAAQADVDQAFNAAAAARDKVSRGIIYAPVDGVVKSVHFERGEIALAGAPAVSLATSNFQIEADVSELDIVKITSGQPVSITFDAFPTGTFTGSVLSINPDEVEKDGDTYYSVAFSLNTQPPGMRPGMSSDVTVMVASRPGALAVSRLAVTEREGKKFVTLVKEGVRSEREVTTGISDREYVEILSGLVEGDQVELTTE